MVGSAGGEVVTLHVWRVHRRGIPSALRSMALDRKRARALPGARFAKLLGTGGGQNFSVRDAELTRWALLVSWASPEHALRFEDSVLARGWRQRALESWQVLLRPLSSRGRWSGCEPFAIGTAAEPAESWHGPVAAITRARLRPTRALSFWRAVPAVAADLHAAGAPWAAFGVGEAPVGVQGTFSLWPNASALQAFAYGRPAHRAVIRDTNRMGWYAEELFARFAVLDSHGTLDGTDPLARS